MGLDDYISSIKHDNNTRIVLQACQQHVSKIMLRSNSIIQISWIEAKTNFPESKTPVSFSSPMV